MVSGDGVDLAAVAGCWVSCHHDSRTMPDTPKADALAASAVKNRLDLSLGVTKYLGDTRAALEISESPRGGWDKLKPAAEIEALKQKGAFWTWSVQSGKHESGHVLEQRVMTGGQPATFRATSGRGLDRDHDPAVESRESRTPRSSRASFTP